MQWLFGRGKREDELTPQEAQQLVASGEQVYFLDVREPEEYREAHIAGSVLVPLGQLAFQLEKLPKDRPIVAVCRSGNRSDVATAMLRRAGFANVRNLHGGVVAWARSGLPLRRYAS